MTWSAVMQSRVGYQVRRGRRHTFEDGLTVHMGYEYLAYLRYFESLSCVLCGLQRELSQGAFSPVYHWYRSTTIPEQSEGKILHREPSPTTSSTREEQLRDSEGPPPEEVPKKVAVIHCDIQVRTDFVRDSRNYSTVIKVTHQGSIHKNHSPQPQATHIYRGFTRIQARSCASS